MGDTSVKLLANGLVPDEDGNQYITDFLVKPSDLLLSTSAPTEDTTEGKKAVHSSGLWASEEQLKEAYEKGPTLTMTVNSDETVDALFSALPHYYNAADNSVILNIPNATIDLRNMSISSYPFGSKCRNKKYASITYGEMVSSWKNSYDLIYSNVSGSAINITKLGTSEGVIQVVGGKATINYYIPAATKILPDDGMAIGCAIISTNTKIATFTATILAPSLVGHNSSTVYTHNNCKYWRNFAWAGRATGAVAQDINVYIPKYNAPLWFSYHAGPSNSAGAFNTAVTGSPTAFKSIKYLLDNLNKTPTATWTINIGVDSSLGQYNGLTLVPAATVAASNLVIAGTTIAITAGESMEDIAAAINAAAITGITASAETVADRKRGTAVNGIKLTLATASSTAIERTISASSFDAAYDLWEPINGATPKNTIDTAPVNLQSYMTTWLAAYGPGGTTSGEGKGWTIDWFPVVHQ